MSRSCNAEYFPSCAMTFSIIAFSIMPLGINNFEQKDHMLNVTYAQSCIFSCYTECRHTEYRYAECRGTFLLTVKPFSACLNCCVK